MKAGRQVVLLCCSFVLTSTFQLAEVACCSPLPRVDNFQYNIWRHLPEEEILSSFLIVLSQWNDWIMGHFNGPEVSCCLASKDGKKTSSSTTAPYQTSR